MRLSSMEMEIFHAFASWLQDGTGRLLSNNQGPVEDLISVSQDLHSQKIYLCKFQDRLTGKVWHTGVGTRRQSRLTLLD